MPGARSRAGRTSCGSRREGRRLQLLSRQESRCDGGRRGTGNRRRRARFPSAKYRHDVEGYTARLDTIQALVLLHKLPLLDSWNEERRAAAQAYSEQLMGVGDLTLPPMPADRASVWHLYVVRTSDPDRLSAFLAERRIGTGRHYPEPAHLAPAYSWLGYRRGAFPIAEELCDHALSLPMFAGISEEQLQVVVEAISDFFRGG